MRDVKFRGHNGIKWIYSREISGIPCFDEIHYFMPNEENELTQEYIGNWDSVSYVGQYTGLKDKNEKEIYEGDIVEYYDDSWDDCFKAKCVKFNNGIFWADDIILTKISYRCKVIGNIHDNPELIK